MSDRLRVLAGQEPDEVDLELRLLGELGDPEAQRAIEAAASGPLSEAQGELEAAREAWASAPKLELPRARRRRRSGRVVVGLALVAGLLAALVLGL